MQNRNLLFITVILVVSAVLRCWNINQSFWWDELWSTIPYATADRLWIIVSRIGLFFNNHILYSLMAHLCISLINESECAARLPALLMGLAGVYALFRFSNDTAGKGPAVIASFLLAISAFHIDHSTEARGYTTLVFFSFLSSWFFLKACTTNRRKDWGKHIFFTVLAYYAHPFMIAVSISQFACILLLYALERLKIAEFDRAQKVVKNYIVSQALAATATLFLYAPVLRHFSRNVKNVRIVDVDRLPFVIDLLNALFPGISSVPGAVLYGLLFLSGMIFILKKNLCLFVFCLLLFFLPITLYLSTNPMLVFERYFIFILPFALFVVSCGIISVAGYVKQKPAYKNGLVIVLVLAITCLQLPAIKNITTCDRQNYREAVGFLESRMIEPQHSLVFSIGYAGEFFKYYAETEISRPVTFDEFTRSIRGKKHIWCLITAWLPSIRPPHEDIVAYSEPDEHVKIYDFVQKHFTLQKEYPTKFPTRVYLLEQ